MMSIKWILRPCHGGPYSCARPRGFVLVCQDIETMPWGSVLMC
jgi:hypothetical protein